MKILGQDDWLFFARRDDGVLVWTVTEKDWHWLEAPHGSDCWDPATMLNCDGEGKFTCRRDCAWMLAWVAAHPGDYEWEECGTDTDGSYLGWPPEDDEEFTRKSRVNYLPRGEPPAGHRKEVTMPLTDENLAALRRLAETPAEVSSGEHAAAQSRLAGAVPELLDEIERLRAQLAGPGSSSPAPAETAARLGR